MCEWTTVTNGIEVAFARSVMLANQTPGQSSLQILKISTLESTELATEFANVAYVEISNRYVVWSGYSSAPNTPGREIFYHDLSTGVTDVVPSSYLYYSYDVTTSGERLVYAASENWAAAPWHLILHDISTGADVWLATDDDAAPAGFISGNLVAFATASFSGGTSVRPADIALYDAASGLLRRLTTQATNRRPAAFWFPYLVIIDVLELWPQTLNDYYVANLVELGVTDATGNLIPGDPVIEPVR
jgi:hypothetical protein